MRYIMYYFKQLHTYAGKILYINLLGMIVISFFEGLAILLILPMINLSGVIELDVQSVPFLHYFDFMEDYPRKVGLPILLGLYILIIIAQQVLQNRLGSQRTRIQVGFINSLRLNIYHLFLQAKWEFFIKRRRSDLINALTNELGRVKGGTNQLLNLISTLIFTSIQIGIAFLLSPTITLFVIICGITLSLFTRRYIRRSREIGNNTTELGKNYYAGITDHFNGIKEIKSNSLEKNMRNWLVDLNKRIIHEKMENVKIQNESQLFFKAASSMLIALFIYISLNLFQAKPEQLVLIVLIFSNLWPKFTGIQKNLEKIASSIPACQSIYLIQEECKKLQESSANDKKTVVSIKTGIKCRDVFFRYNKEQPVYALQNINLDIPANCTIAIVGRSGAGKSTLIDILMGLLSPEQGDVCIDGIPITSENVFYFRKLISYVPQDPFLFNGSIRDNLTLVQPHASEDEIWEALTFAAADEFTERLPNGIDTIIGDRGIRLSGGERQRLVLARAILRKPSILVLDEATSALDTENEGKIQDALERLKGKMTIIIIAHRLSTIRNADQVIVLEKGRLVQNGGFNELAKEHRGMFSHLLGRQIEYSQELPL